MIILTVMKLTIEQVEKITDMVLNKLREKDLIIYKADEAQVRTRMIDAFLDDLRDEDKLDQEVEKILSGHSDTINTERVDYRKMFNMIKGKLARERGIIL